MTSFTVERFSHFVSNLGKKVRIYWGREKKTMEMNEKKRWERMCEREKWENTHLFICNTNRADAHIDYSAKCEYPAFQCRCMCIQSTQVCIQIHPTRFAHVFICVSIHWHRTYVMHIVRINQSVLRLISIESNFILNGRFECGRFWETLGKKCVWKW